MTKHRAILFDFDYTLVDSSEGIVKCAQHAFETMGFRVESGDIKQAIGLPLPDKYHALTGDLEHGAGQEFKRLFMDKQVDVMTDNTVLFDGVEAVLQHLRQRGYRIAIVSTKTSTPIVELLKRERLQHYFEFIVGGEHVSQHKPHPEGAEIALTKLDLAAPQALFIGDSVIDAGTAQRAGMDFIATLSGMTQAHEFEQFPYLALLERVEHLIDSEHLGVHASEILHSQ